MTIRVTRTVDISIQAVSPLSSVGCAAAAAEAASCATAGAASPSRFARASSAKRRFIAVSLEGVGPGFSSADTDHLGELGDEDLAVADLAGAGGLLDRFHDLLEQVGADCRFHLDLRQE